jgi:hypothetical protein
MQVAVEHAHSLPDPSGTSVVGHLELLGEVAENSMEITRVVLADPGLLRQLPPDWKP